MIDKKIRTFFKPSLKKVFMLVGLKVKQCDRTFPELWSRIPEFQLLYKEIKDHTVVDEDRCFMLYQLSRSTNTYKGDVAEVGVYKGGTGKLLAKTCPDKTVFLFDTFSGEPAENPEIDFHKKGDLADTSLEFVREFCRDRSNVKLFPGIFPYDTCDVIKDKFFSFVHIDVGLYRSIMDSLRFFYERMLPSGIIVLEGYEWKACPGAKKAITEFLAGKPEVPVITAKYQCMIVKRR